jgi:hypothetical protein
MAYMLNQLAEVETDRVRKGIIRNIIRDAKVMEALPFENVDSLTNMGLRWRTLPDVAFRKLNTAYTEDTGGHVEPVWESVYPFGGEIRFDRLYKKVKNHIVAPEVLQTEMKVKAMAYKFSDYFINGDHAVDGDGFEGLKKRVAGMPARQTVWFAASNAAALDPIGSIGNARTFIDKWEEMFMRCNGGDVGMIICNEAMILGFGRVLRYAQTTAPGVLDVTKDSFDRPLYTYRGVPMFDIGLKKDQTTEIILDTETAGDAGADATSIYMVSLGTGDQQLTGIQLGPLEKIPLGQEQGGVTEGLFLEWVVGLANFGSYGIVRGRNVEGASQW